MNNKEIDRLIAENVMGWVQGTCNGDPMLIPPEYLKTIDELKFVLQPSEDYYLTSFHPTTDIRDAWEVVEKMKPNIFNLKWSEYRDRSEEWECSFTTHHSTISVYSNTSPRAICLAALKAVSVEVSE